MRDYDLPQDKAHTSYDVFLIDFYKQYEKMFPSKEGAIQHLVNELKINREDAKALFYNHG